MVPQNRTVRSAPDQATGEVLFEPDHDLSTFAEALNFEIPPRQAYCTGGLPQTIPIVIMSDDLQRFEAVDAQWGLVPRWHDGALKTWTSNRRWTPIDDVTGGDPSETLWRHYHCLVPIIGFTLPSFDGRHLLRARSSTSAPMAAAGLWRQYRQGGHEVTSFTILTRSVPHSLAANPEQEPILLSEADWWVWLVHQSLRDLQASPVGQTQCFDLSDRPSPFKSHQVHHE
ncbi:SOS response-associated peptidase family protein [Asticcacaulis excentricus]|uniref:Abasic site processing protein n=1 Tax=Asticcacaulis excentricus (strain ATCC 15261 / DSM 4724 / KCTC 12464 / NCIMB 9791 / VKM B-1370 / CB 48) TaxID=573065 RepID=E8RS49_ASTEC|nr:SOS response-associated peptidase family protein [Asticcacaulis excentricus]ADU14320.1 protein of unknown function DUF159 [Asticcacaulis excentricus CB 48]